MTHFLFTAKSMRRVKELPTGKKISRYPGLKSQDPLIYVQKKGSMMRRVEELPTGKKISRYPGLKSHDPRISVQKKESMRTGESHVPQCSTLSCSLFISMDCMCKSKYIHAYNIPFHSKGEKNWHK
jgi:hypothetical protein